ncbi:MAG TPA: amidohydrolase family protein [Propioniciclava sp.]|uniref:amidohydrolase family protein n=1 Tax=Propioniciclava sp. TaxID=2038686 RepID=UPI002C2EB872|nr:amidohydrolase family protein [Propioniciclava sp.]HRL49070.1 amidohydrolase family protein [Propioniciclava sp.]HRL80138.1 amidohydrolase family protein [Propioniciclava sp.]
MPHDDALLGALGEPLVSITHSHGGAAHTHHVPAGSQAHAQPRLHLTGHLLPDAEPVELWVVEGRITYERVPGATTLATDAWLMPGLVDAHCHIGLDGHGAVDPATAERQALTDRNAGTLLVRDAGSPADTHWIDERADLPRIIRAGRHIARPRRYIRNFAAEVEPEDLIAEVRTQARRGDGWVKLVGDWIDREAGDLRPLWPTEVVRDAIAAAHEEGARVTAHTFDEQAVAELVAAGIDGIEHGTGLDDATIELMAERGVALVPTLINIETFPDIAAAADGKFPAYAAHMRALHARRFTTLGKAVDAGVPIYAGTDAGGTLAHGILPEEIALLARVGGAEFALGAASWRAREWLGADQLTEGASADLIVCAGDPRSDLGELRRPVAILLRGRVITAV